MAKVKTQSPVLANYLANGQEDLKEPLRFTEVELERITIDLMGYPFLSFGNALLCPKCGVQQGILTNVAPDGEVNFYLNFRCEHYKILENEKIDALGASADAAPAAEGTVQEPQPENPQPNPEG